MTNKDYSYDGEIVFRRLFSVDARYDRKILSDRKMNYCLNGSVYALAGFEQVSSPGEVMADGGILQNGNRFAGGAGIKLELEVFVSNGCILFLQTRPRVLFGTSFGNFQTVNCFGIKLKIN